jgi:uncharacterized protein (DUF58 family)
VTHEWRPTDSLVRAGVCSVLLVLVAVLTGRPDLLVLGVPLLALAVASAATRPGTVPRASSRLLHQTLREGEGTTLRVRVDGAEDVEHAVVALAEERWVVHRPPLGVVGTTAPVPPVEQLLVDVPLASLRWGRRPAGHGAVTATGGWAGFQSGPFELEPTLLTTLPAPGPFGSRAPAPHPIGLVGTNPARRPGDGSEFAGIRPFHPGDRLRRLQWPVSLRTGTLHVTSTVAEEDSSVLLIVDSGVEIGASRGLGGSSSSLDVAVRAAGAVGEHYLHRGDRVGLRVLGSTSQNVVPTAAGRRHLRRLLETLTRIVPGEARDTDAARMSFRVSAGGIVIVLSPMLSETAIAATVTLAQRGLDVIVVDTVPQPLDLGDEDPLVRLAWRMRALEREGLLGKVRRAGIPVVAWRGPGTLDEVLRMLARRASSAKLARR